jgi:hypothetical protein
MAIKQSYFPIPCGQNGDDKHPGLPFKGRRIKLCLSVLHNILQIFQKSSHSLKPQAAEESVFYKITSVKVLTT